MGLQKYRQAQRGAYPPFLSVSRRASAVLNSSLLVGNDKHHVLHGFTHFAVRPMDMFPQTCHVESVVLVTKNRIPLICVNKQVTDTNRYGKIAP